MTSVFETAYPRLKAEVTEKELQAVYNPKRSELEFVTSQYRQVTQRVFLLIQLKLLQRLGYFMPLAQVPEVIIEYICGRAKWRKPTRTELTKFDKSGSKSVHHQRLRDYIGIKSIDDKLEQLIEERAVAAAQTKQELPDIINVLIEELVQRRYELPGFSYLARVAGEARNAVNESIYKGIAGVLSPDLIKRLDQLLQPTGGKSEWDGLKREPKRPNHREVTDFLKHIEAMKALAEGLPETSNIPAVKREALILEARAKDVTEMNDMVAPKRYTLAVLLIQAQVEQAMDDIAEIFVKTVRGLQNAAERKLEEYQLAQSDKVDRLVGCFRSVLKVLAEKTSEAERMAKVNAALGNDVDEWLGECDELMAYAGRNSLPFMLDCYGNKRGLLFKCVDAMSLRSSSQDESLLDAIKLIRHHRFNHREYVPANEAGLEDLELDWMSEKWRSLVFRRNSAATPEFAHRKYFELAVFSAVMDELKSGDLYVEHSGIYDDWRNHLATWEEYEREVKRYGEMVGLATEPDLFVEKLRTNLSTLAREVDDRFPENGTVEIDEAGSLVIRRHEKSEPPQEMAQIDGLLTEGMNPASILDILTETEKWLDLHKLFGPLSGLESKIDDKRKRFITTLFCYGCNLGPTQTARSVKGLSRRQVAWLNLKHVTEQRLDKAIFKVVNAYNKFALPRYWGTGKSASADGTKWNLYEQNLLSEYHIRYGGYGGIGYYHVSDKYIALFSHFIPCGVYEAVYILDGLINNQSDIQPDTLHGDTQSQSGPVFALAHLLGIELMPRIRNIKDLLFYKAERNDRYEHIGPLFRGTINWELIQRHLKDMLRVVISIKMGKVAPSTILRRLGSASRKNKLYYAFRELGRVIRTMFLLKYINDAELRRTINAATNKSEEFNDFVKWSFFGGDGIISENMRHEQRKVVKYNHLVANMIILHNVHEMTRVLKRIQSQGYVLTEQVLKGLAPYRREHINRFGEYTLDLDRVIPPMEWKAEFAI
jgi:TnpA family transposase